jgi:hypothetical protein
VPALLWVLFDPGLVFVCKLMQTANMDDDEVLIFAYLNGRVDRQRRVHYLEPGGAEEKKARDALLALLRSSRDLTNVQWRLAALLDPDDMKEPRRLAFQKRRRGGQLIRDVSIAFDLAVAERRGDKIDDDCAISVIAERHGVSKRQAWRAWSKHGKPWREKLADTKTS